MTESLLKPMDTKELLRRRDGQGFVTGVVTVELSEVIDYDLESFLDTISERLTGSTLLADISYKIVGLGKDDEILIEVCGDVSMILEDEEAASACGKCGGRSIWVPTFCNFGHCANCFRAWEDYHRECAWNGTEHESYQPCSDLPGKVCACGADCKKEKE